MGEGVQRSAGQEQKASVTAGQGRGFSAPSGQVQERPERLKGIA